MEGTAKFKNPEIDEDGRGVSQYHGGKYLDEIGVVLAEVEELDQMEVVFQGLCEHVCGKPHPGLLDMPGVTPAQVGSFYKAADYFFRQAPWKKVGYEAAIKVECDKFQSGP